MHPQAVGGISDEEDLLIGDHVEPGAHLRRIVLFGHEVHRGIAVANRFDFLPAEMPGTVGDREAAFGRAVNQVCGRAKASREIGMVADGAPYRRSSRVNITLLERPLQKVVVYLNPEEFHSTWLGNKAIYRTRMAIADGGELVVLAPWVERFGEDSAIDALVRRYGYAGTPTVRRAVRDHADLAKSLGAAAHLIHGSSEGRFTITYCPGPLGRDEIEAVGYRYAPLEEMLERYNPAKMSAGPNVIAGEEVYFIANPAHGLWAHRDRFLSPQEDSCKRELAHRT